MAKTGLAIIGFAFFLLIAFICDQVFFREQRVLEQNRVYYPQDDEEVDPRLADPELYNPSLADDISSERFMLNADEMKRASLGEDYQYTIQGGESIDHLARKYLGRHELKKLLYEENPNLAPGEPIPPGTKIKIPFRYRMN